MSIWRRIRKIPAFIFREPLRMLALVVFILLAVNYKTLLEGLPTSVPELEALVADVAPITLKLTGSVTGTDQECWRMRFTFLDEAGERLLSDTDHVYNLGTLRPQETVTLPHRDAYQLRLQTDVIIAETVNRCFPVGGTAVVRAKGQELVARDLDTRTEIVNACDFSGASNDCTLEFR